MRVKTASERTFDAWEVVAWDDDQDLALLASPESGRPLRVAKREPRIGEEIVVIGNPAGLEATLSTGVISGVRSDPPRRLYQMTASISPGSSGGPVLLGDGSVVGISTYILRQGQSLNFAISASALDRLSQSRGRTRIASIGGREGTLATRRQGSARASGITGTWFGVLTQESGGLSPEYPFMMSFEQSGSAITGFSVIADSNVERYAVMIVTGSVRGSSVEFEEVGVLFQESPRGGFWCIKSGTLRHNSLQDAIEGSWSAPACSPGRIRLFRTE